MHRSLSVIVLLLALIGSALPVPDAGLAQGQVYSDPMDSAETGLLSTDTFDPTISFAYQDGFFVVDVQQPSYRGDITSTLNVPELASSRLTVDALIAGDPHNKYVIAGCRQSDAGEGYHFGYLPATGDVLLWRRDATGDVNLAEANDPSLIDLGTTGYQIGIDCVAGIMTGIVNGEPVLSAFDDTYATGRPTIGLGANGLETDGLSVAFDNLTVTDNGELEFVSGPTVTPTLSEPAGAVGTTTQQLAPMRDPNVDPDGALSDAFTISLQTLPVVSELGGDADVELASLSKLPAGVQLADFYAEICYTTPAVRENTSYLVGFCFWTDPAGNCYDVYLQDTGGGAARWGYGYDTAAGEYQALQSGDLPAGSIDPTPGATNFLSLTVYQGVAILSGNTFDAAAVIPLQGTPIAGDVQSEIAFLDLGESGVIAPLSMSTWDFAVWDLSSGMVPIVGDANATSSVASGPALPPLAGSSGVDASFDQTRTAAVNNPPLAAGLSGSFTQESDVYSYTSAGVSVADFYTIVTFTNPTDLSVPFDIGIGFRDDQDSESGLRFVVTSDGSWYMQLPGQDPYASGAATGFIATPGATNTIEILVQGAAGTVAVNGVVLPQFDLSTVTTRGDVYIGAGFFVGDTLAGRTIPYSNWWIFPTDILDFPSS